jgi:HK97 family phage major capsid protein
MSTQNHKDLLDKRGQALKELDILSETIANEKRAMNSEEQSKFDKLYAEVDGINKTVESLKRKAELDAKEIGKNEERGLSQEQVDKKEERKAVFRKYMAEGEKSLNGKELTALNELRAQSTSTTAGGFLIPEGFSYEVDMAMKAWGGVMNVARVIPTTTGNDLPWPRVNDTANSASILSENTEATDLDMVFASTTLKSFNYTTGVIRVSKQLFTDSGIPVEGLIAEAYADRMGRGTNAHFTTGNGTTQPQGVVTAADGTGVTNAAQTAISFDDLINLKYALDPAYRANGTFMLNDQTLKAIVQLSIGTNYDQPLWQASYREGQPDTILGHRYIVNQDMANIGSANVSVLFGDFSKYIIRDIGSAELTRLDESYAQFYQVGFVMFKRYDGRYIGSTGAQAAIKKLTHAT